jgi:kinetochore protein NNF1
LAGTRAALRSPNAGSRSREPARAVAHVNIHHPGQVNPRRPDRDNTAPAMPAATMPDSRSPSPVSAPPIAEAPGPRAQGLINIFNQAVKATLDKCSAANFASCFPTAAEYSPEVLENLRSQIVDQLERTWKTNFEDIVARRNVVQLLNSLDQCIEDARLRKKRAEAAANGGPVETPVP